MKGTYLETVSFNIVLGADLSRYTPTELLAIFERKLCRSLKERSEFTFPAERLHRIQKRNHIRMLVADIRKLRSLAITSQHSRRSAAGVIKQMALSI
ncbi:hypothetical protein [Photobacterium lutimaris]|uniref:Uncharacterized protein n=1 Tax=Photobacterium lutimaris TaxID=388278 RepID=A0A2T3J4V3_9GAMM|nr:hypothetical protein [Photobacterium lutimaris]PSU36311.1 hypothetical protein C9I99_04760 [Photobacterium lutimaris]TDR74799.1 hypothetical protein DFP78_106130 [Photobacterium lutimaris]